MNSTMPTPNDLSFEHSHMLCDVIEQIFEHHGIASSLAHLYAVVFSSATQPVRLTDAARVAGVAKSTASVGLRKLESCGLLSKHTLHDPVQRSLWVQNLDIHPHTTGTRHRARHQPLCVRQVEVEVRLARRIGQADVAGFPPTMVSVNECDNLF